MTHPVGLEAYRHVEIPYSSIQMEGTKLPNTGMHILASSCRTGSPQRSKRHTRKGHRENTHWNTMKIPWKHPENTLKTTWNSRLSVRFPYALCGYALAPFQPPGPGPADPLTPPPGETVHFFGPKMGHCRHFGAIKVMRGFWRLLRQHGTFLLLVLMPQQMVL